MEQNYSALWTNTSWTSNDTLSNHDLEFTDYDESLRLGFYSVTDDYGLGAAYLTIAFLGLVFNPIAICVLYAGKSTDSTIKLQLINLAVADFLTALLDPALEMTWQLELEFPSSLTLCMLTEILAKWAFYASILWTTVLSIENFMVVYFPLKVRNYTPRYKRIVAGTVWVLAFLPHIEILLHQELYFFNEHGYYLCVIFSAPYGSLAVDNALLATKYTAPLLIIITMYSLIGIKIARQKVIGEGLGISQETMECKDRKMQVLKMLFTDAVVTTVTWSPLYIYYLAIDKNDLSYRAEFIVHNVLAILHTSNCFTTPLIYYAVNKSFREDTHTLFRRVCRRVKCFMLRRSTSSDYLVTSGTGHSSISISSIASEFDKEERMAGDGNGSRISSHHSSANHEYFESKI